jgi:hypothetical protein
LGFVELHLRQWKAARETTRQAIAHAQTDEQRAAAEYNLGRIEEAQYDDAAAMAAYGRSLKLRPNRTVSRRAAALAARAKGASGPLLGPFPSLDALCARMTQLQQGWQASDRDIDEPDSGQPPRVVCDRCEFVCRYQDARRIATGLPPPLEEVLVFFSASRERESSQPAGPSHGRPGCETFLDVAARLKQGWFLAPNLASSKSTWAHGGPACSTEEALELREGEVKPIGPGDARGVAIRFRVDETELSHFPKRWEGVSVLGVGPSTIPSLSGPLVVHSYEGAIFYGQHSDDTDVTETSRQWHFDRGAFVIDQETVDHNGRETTRHRARRQRLVFP